ncbi:MAG TPA: DUF4249 family protein [Longimicrobium sp.]|jgi:hypothetical protein
MAFLRHLAGYTAAIFLCGCTDATAPVRATEENVAVHAVLAAGTDTASLLLTRFDPAASQDEPRFHRVPGASVRLLRGADTLWLREAPAGFSDCNTDAREPGEIEEIGRGCYAAVVPDGLRAGDRYELRVTLADGTTIRGAATIPGAPDILAPATARVVAVRTPESPLFLKNSTAFPVRWRIHAGTGRVEIGVVRPQAYRDGRPLARVACHLQPGPLPADLVRTDSVTHQVVSASCSRGGEIVRWDSISTRLVLTAYDTAYARYAREVLGGSVRATRASAGVEGAFGVFAGAASAERRLTLVPATD